MQSIRCDVFTENRVVALAVLVQIASIQIIFSEY